MKKTFNAEEFISLAGCWRIEKPKQLIKVTKELSSINGDNLVHISDLAKHEEVSIKDCNWFIINNCQCSIYEEQQLALCYAKSVAFIYNKKYLLDNRVSMCINITARYLKGLVSIDTLLKYRKIAADAADAAYAAADAAYAADAADAAYAAADAAYAAADAAYAAADAAYAADDAAYAAANAANTAACTTKIKLSLSKLIKSLE